MQTYTCVICFSKLDLYDVNFICSYNGCTNAICIECNKDKLYIRDCKPCSIKCFIDMASYYQNDTYMGIYIGSIVRDNQLQLYEEIMIGNRYKYVVEIYPNVLAKIISEYYKKLTISFYNLCFVINYQMDSNQCVACLDTKCTAFKCVHCNISFCLECKQKLDINWNRFEIKIICSKSCIFAIAVGENTISLVDVKVYDDICFIDDQIEIYNLKVNEHRYKRLIEIYPNVLAKIISEYYKKIDNFYSLLFFLLIFEKR